VITIGIDVGSVSVKAAAIGTIKDEPVLKRSCLLNNSTLITEGETGGVPILISRYDRILGEPMTATHQLLTELVHCFPSRSINGIRFTGVSGQSLAKELGVGYASELESVARAVRALCPQARTIFEMGGNSSKYIRVDTDGNTHGSAILDYEKNGDCAAGTGAFIDQQSSRLRYAVEEIGNLVLSVDVPAKIAGRCTVFSKTDMVHAQQRGYTPPQILKGLCEAVVRNFKGTVVKGKKIVPSVALVGGMAANAGIVQAIQQIFSLEGDALIVHKAYAWMSAIGAAMREIESRRERQMPALDPLQCLARFDEFLQNKAYQYPGNPPLSLQNVVLLRNQTSNYSFEHRSLPVDAYLGIDIGSVSTNLAVIDAEGSLIHSIYLRTNSRPIEVVSAGLLEIEEKLADKVRIVAVGATGSGREMIGEIVGADAVHDEITAHKTGAVFVAKNLLNSDVDTIFEIGGQDAKFIRLEKGIVVDFSMNEACSAGTGSFLEEQAERLGIRIEDEFASIALNATKPIRLGERCTVFMEKDLIAHLQQGADKKDLIAGLAYSTALNYLNRVVRGRKIGDVIFFQGGTAYNDAVAAAFSHLLSKRIIVPPYNGVIGAVGAALLALHKALQPAFRTRFRGYQVGSVDYDLREFVCHVCSNSCTIQEFRVEKECTYWGNKCSDRFRKRPKTDQRPVIQDLFASREKLLQKDDSESGQGPRIGMPRSMYYYDSFPFWHTYFRKIECRVIVSEPTNRRLIEDGFETAMAEPCFPIQIAHGHVRRLSECELDYIFVPNTINTWIPEENATSHLCLWGQTLPFVLASARALAEIRDRILMPNIHFQEGMRHVQKELWDTAKTLGVSRRVSNRAVEAAFHEQLIFSNHLIEMGKQALRELTRHRKMGIVILGRPYTLYDYGANLDIFRRVRDAYGVNFIPMDFLDVDSVDIRGLHGNMFWNYGRKMLQASRIVKDNPNLHIMHVTNFRCGPDSFISHYVGHISGKPFLTLQLDGHGNDAGAMTRCEAYLESKGLL
jgi:predicted CoA-substrate-specific enzyme activase